MKDLKVPVDKDDSAEDFRYFSDNDLEENEDEKSESPSAEHASTVETHPFNLFATPDKDKFSFVVNLERAEKGKVVKIPDVVFVT